MLLMSESPDIVALRKQLEAAAADPATPPWVQALLQTVLLMVGVLLSTIERLEAELAEHKRARFGRKSEKSSPIDREVKKRTAAADRKARSGPPALDDVELPTEIEDHEVPREELSCDQCGGHDFVAMGVEESTEYEYIPSRIKRVRHRQHKYACKKGCCVVMAPSPLRVTEGGRFGPELHAHVVVSRCADSLPFHRQARQWARQGVPLSPSTLCDLFHRTAECLRPLYGTLIDEICRSPYLNADETPQPVLDVGQCRRGYMWTFGTDEMAAFVFSPTRSGETPKRLLEGTTGVLQVDGHSGYNAVCAPDSRKRAGCWAHARRKLLAARDSAPDEATWLLERITALYIVEHDAKEAGIVGTDEHLALRTTRSAPLVEEIRERVAEHRKTARPKSPYGTALGYIHNQWNTLKTFLGDAKVRLDNNLAERTLRIIALGRKNSLFVGHDDGGERLAILQSLVTSCLLSGVNPHDYLADVLIRVNTHPAKRIEELLPHRWKPLAAPPPEPHFAT